DAARRTVRASGPVSAANAAFGVTLGRYTAEGQTYRGREGAVHVPEQLADSIEAVLGLDNRIQAHTRLKRGDGIPETELPDVDADGEVLLDIEVCGAIAHGAKLVVYFSDPTDRGFFDAISGAVHDSENRPSVISISWGGAEDNWTGQSRAAFDGLLADAAAL